MRFWRSEKSIPTAINGEQGFSLLEVLVGICLLAISGLAVTSSTIHAIRSLKFIEVNHIADSLAISRMEEIAALDTVDITSSLNGTISEVNWPGTNITFTQTTAVVENVDGSRTVTIDVASNDEAFPTSVTFMNTFALWE